MPCNEAARPTNIARSKTNRAILAILVNTCIPTLFLVLTKGCAASALMQVKINRQREGSRVVRKPAKRIRAVGFCFVREQHGKNERRDFGPTLRQDMKNEKPAANWSRRTFLKAAATSVAAVASLEGAASAADVEIPWLMPET